MIGIADWLASELDHLGVEIRFNTYPEEADVLALGPDVVVMANGSFPIQDIPEGGEFTMTDSDVPGRPDTPTGPLLFFDQTGAQGAPGTAQHLAEAGA